MRHDDRHWRNAVSVFLLTAMLTGTLASCGGESTPSGGDTALSGGETSETPETAPEYVYPEKDYGGHEFTILNQDVCGWANRLCVPEETNADLINDAMYERNNRIAQRFNIKIVEQTASKNDLPSLVRTAAASGDESYGMAFVPVDVINGLMLDGSLVDLSSIESLNLDKPWWDNAVVDAATIDGKCYFATSDISFFPFEATWILYFNEDRFTDLGLEFPYQTVRDGKWTIDKLTELDLAGVSLNGQDSFKYDPSNVAAYYGMVTHSQIVQSLIFSCGETLLKRDGDSFSFDGDSERAYTIYEKIAKLLGTPGAYLSPAGFQDNDANPFSRTQFRTGHFMFMSETLGHIAGLRDWDGDFGVLPLPKLDESQDSYHSMVATWGTLMTTIPASVKDTERSGVILDALAYDSYKNLLNPYYDTYLTQKGARNEDSAEMLKVVRDTRIINAGHMLGWTQEITNSIVGKLNNGDASVASTIASAKDKVAEKIKNTFDTLNGN